MLSNFYFVDINKMDKIVVVLVFISLDWLNDLN